MWGAFLPPYYNGRNYDAVRSGHYPFCWAQHSAAPTAWLRVFRPEMLHIRPASGCNMGTEIHPHACKAGLNHTEKADGQVLFKKKHIYVSYSMEISECIPRHTAIPAHLSLPYLTWALHFPWRNRLSTFLNMAPKVNGNGNKWHTTLSQSQRRSIEISHRHTQESYRKHLTHSTAIMPM